MAPRTFQPSPFSTQRLQQWARSCLCAKQNGQKRAGGVRVGAEVPLVITLLIHIVIVLVVLGLLYWLLTLIPLPEPFPRIIQVVVIVIAVLYVLSVLLPYAGFGGPSPGPVLR